MTAEYSTMVCLWLVDEKYMDYTGSGFMKKMYGEKQGMVRGVVVVIVILLLVLVGTLVSMLLQDSEGGGNDAPIVVGVPNWSSAIGTAYILRELLQRDFAVDVQLYSGTNEEIYAGIANGMVDVHPEGWTPNHDDWFEMYADVLRRNDVGVYAFQGLCVDRNLADQYGVKQITDLLNPDLVQHFDSDGDGLGEAWVGADGWGATTVERIRARSYGYDKFFELLKMEEVDALERLTKATNAGKLFAMYCYTPHSMWRTHTLYQLEEPPHDPAKWQVVFPSEDPDWLEKSSAPVGWKLAELHLYYARALEGRHPEIATYLRRIQFTAEELLQITYDLDTGDQDPATYAKQWVMKNR